jgi:hypothetical protein
MKSVESLERIAGTTKTKVFRFASLLVSTGSIAAMSAERPSVLLRQLKVPNGKAPKLSRWTKQISKRARAAANPSGVGHDQLALQLSQYGQHPEHGAALCGGGIDALFENPQSDAALA